MWMRCNLKKKFLQRFPYRFARIDLSAKIWKQKINKVYKFSNKKARR